jgi:hypothetical protein
MTVAMEGMLQGSLGFSCRYRRNGCLRRTAGPPHEQLPVCGLCVSTQRAHHPGLSSYSPKTAFYIGIFSFIGGDGKEQMDFQGNPSWILSGRQKKGNMPEESFG